MLCVMHRQGVDRSNSMYPHDKVEHQILQHLIREWFPIVAINVHAKLQEILLRLVVSMDSAVADDVESEICNDLLVSGNQLGFSRHPLAELVRACKDTVEDYGVQAVECCCKLDFFLWSL